MRKSQQKINLRGQEVVYCLKTSARARNLRIVVGPGGVLTAVRPFFASDRSVESFLFQKSNWILDKIAKQKFKKNLLACGTRTDFSRHKSSARELVFQKIEKFNQIYRFEFNRVAIRNQQTRWGSCSYKKNMNFNYRIVLLPEHLGDYIVVHELCHLREMNHSPRFWNLVAVAVPDYLPRREELRNY